MRRWLWKTLVHSSKGRFDVTMVATLVALAEYLKEQFRAGLRERHIAEFVNDEQFDGGGLRLEFEGTPIVARFNQLINEPGRREEGDREAALIGREAERQTGV